MMKEGGERMEVVVPANESAKAKSEIRVKIYEPFPPSSVAGSFLFFITSHFHNSLCKPIGKCTTQQMKLLLWRCPPSFPLLRYGLFYG